MSALILFLYSKYYPNINILLNLVSSLDFVHSICVDNTRVRDVIMRSSMVSVKKVPCFIVIFPDKTVNQYVGEDMSSFMNTLLEKTKAPSNGQTKTSIQDLVPEVPETEIEIREEEDDEDDGGNLMEQMRSPPPKQPPPSASLPAKQGQKSGKSDIGSLINFNEGKPAEKKSNTVSRSRSELMNREQVKIPKGTGHENMQSSLAVDISTSKASRDTNRASNMIEDIDEGDDEPMLFASEEKSGMVKNTHKSKTDLKTMAMEMATARGDKIE